MNSTKLSPSAVHLLKRVKEQILKTPERCSHAAVKRTSTCGSVMCVAGWVCELKSLPHLMANAMDALEISGKQAVLLFMPNEEDVGVGAFDKMYSPHRHPPGVGAQTCARYIDKFIEEYTK